MSDNRMGIYKALFQAMMESDSGIWNEETLLLFVACLRVRHRVLLRQRLRRRIRCRQLVRRVGGCSSPEGSSGSAGSDEADPSGCSLRSSTEELLTNEEMRCSSIDSSANGDDSVGEQPDGFPSQSPEKQAPAAFQQGMILPEELLIDEEIRCSSMNSSANGDISSGELPEDVPCQSPEEQTPAAFQ